jgi:anti-anti-sigma factor
MLISFLVRSVRRLARFPHRTEALLAPGTSVGPAQQVAKAAPAAGQVRNAPRIGVVAVEKDGEVVVRVSGEAVLATASALEAGLLRVAARRPPLVTLDLSQLGFISSLAMGVLVTYRRGVVRSGGRVRLAPDLQPTVREALERAGLIDLLEIGGDSASIREESRDLAEIHSF